MMHVWFGLGERGLMGFSLFCIVEVNEARIGLYLIVVQETSETTSLVRFLKVRKMGTTSHTELCRTVPSPPRALSVLLLLRKQLFPSAFISVTYFDSGKNIFEPRENIRTGFPFIPPLCTIVSPLTSCDLNLCLSSDLTSTVHHFFQRILYNAFFTLKAPRPLVQTGGNRYITPA